MSPFDARLMFFALLARRHRMFFHCSWAEWVQGPFPKRVKYQNIRAWWHAFFNKQCQGVFAVSQRNLTTLRQFSGCEVPGTVVNHAVTEAFHARGRAGTGDVFKFIFVGRLVPSKGMDELLAVADGLDPQRFELSVVGYGSQAERMQVACATRANCRFLGRISDQNQLAELYRQHDALLLPSKRTHKWQELFGMVIIEAMACGVVPICTDHVGPCEILAGQSEPIAGDFPAGFLTTEAAFVADAIRISKRLAAGPEERGRLRAAAIAASDQYRDTAIAQRWAALFEAQHAHSRLLK
jgi:glycosyltransferase involved in cell wall biosynthesis